MAPVYIKTVFLFIVFSVGLYAGAQKTFASVTIKNNAAVSLSTLVPLSIDSLLKQSATMPAQFRIIDAKSNQHIYQLTSQNKTCLVWVNLPAKSSVRLLFTGGKSASAEPKVYGRSVPERYGDFAWENDRIAFRMYGAALEKTAENAFGIDVWAKRTSKMVIDNWYKSGDYHTDKGEGLDFYKVGFTLGAGDVAPFVNDSIWFSGNYVRSRIIHNGPLRFCFELDYNPWKVGDISVTATKRITLDAGAQLNKMELTYQLKGADQLPVAVGIVRRKEGGTIWMDQNKGIMAYWEPEQKPNGQMGVAVVTTKPVQMLATPQHLLALDTIYHNQTLTYFFGAAWSKAGIVTSAAQWFDYVQQPNNLQVVYIPQRLKKLQ